MMMLKKTHMKGLRKKALKLEYEQRLLVNLRVGVADKTKPLQSQDLSNIADNVVDKAGVGRSALSEQAKFRILLLRNAPIDESQLKGVKNVGEELVKENPKLTTRVLGKCVKKNILKKLVRADCKYIYWVQPEAQSLKEQLLHLNMLKAYIRAEPKEAFLGCLLESRFDSSSKSLNDTSFSNYKYYYPSQVLSLCDIGKADGDRLGGNNSSTGLEVLGQLLQTIEMSSASLMSVLSTSSAELQKESVQTSNKDS